MLTVCMRRRPQYEKRTWRDDLEQIEPLQVIATLGLGKKMDLSGRKVQET
jgi:hypothetical protein